MSSEPTATGNLQVTPFGHLLVYLLDRSLTGSLVLEEPGGNKHAIWFEAGAPAKVKTAEPVNYLGQLLVEQRSITREVYESSLQGALRERCLHGQVLLQIGAIDARVLKDTLREQLARQVLWLFKLPGATLFGYYDQVNFLERWGAPEGLRIKPLALIWRGLRRHATSQEIDGIVSRLGDRPIELHVDAPIRRFRFESSEQALIDVLRAKPQPLAQLIAYGLAPAEEVRRLVYVLVMLRQLEMGVPGAEPVGADEVPSSSRIPVASGVSSPAGSAVAASGRRSSIPDIEQVVPQFRPSGAHSIDAPPAPPARLPSPVPPSGGSAAGGLPADAAAEVRAELEALAGRLGGDHYQVLGVPPDAPLSVIQTAFITLAKKWHPDRLRPELLELKDQASRLFSRASEASRTLSDPASRRAYDASLATGETAEETEHVQRVLRATSAFQRAEVLFKRGNLALAEQEARAAFEGDPSQADHVALHVWLQAQKPQADLAALLSSLDGVAKTDPMNLRVRWYRGQLLKRLDREREAMAEYRFIVAQDPRHTDARRELRLYTMRRGGRASDPPQQSRPPGAGGSIRPDSASGRPASSPPAKPGLLNKLFKKP